MSTVDYVPARGNVSRLGRHLRQPRRPLPGGHRVSRRAAAQLIFTRGYYTAHVIAAWDYRNGALTQRWVFDSATPAGSGPGRGNHSAVHRRRRQRRRQEIIFGGMTIDDNGTAMCATASTHGDALHVGDFIPPAPAWRSGRSTSRPPARRRHRATPAPARSSAAEQHLRLRNGRGVADDIYAGNPGAEYWGRARDEHLRNASGGSIGRKPARRTSSPGGTPTRSANCWTATTSTSTARAATRAC